MRRSAPRRSIGFIPDFPDRPASFSVAQYDQLTFEQLQTKLTQFPGGTVFHWADAASFFTAQQREAFRQVSDAAARAGMKLVRDSAPAGE